MGVALYIVPEREIEGLDPMVDGKALGRLDDETLETLCREAGVQALLTFFSQDPGELGAFLEEEDECAEFPGQEEWFKAADGLKTVRGLLAHLQAKPKTLENTEDLIRDLSDMETVLLRLQQENVGWHLAVDY